jgi:hypothetical protein
MFVARNGTAAKEIAFLSDFPLIHSYPALLLAMMEEVTEQASPEQTRGFFNAVGARIARRAPLADAEDADALVQMMNEQWAMLGWGRVSLDFAQDGIDIFHSDLPPIVERGEEEVWIRVAPHILEGAYDDWFRSLGGGPRLRTRLVRASPELIELRHGV